MTHSTSSSSSSSTTTDKPGTSSSDSTSDRPDHVSETRHVDSEGNEYITTITYETIQEPIEPKPSPLPVRAAPYISSLKSSPNHSLKSSPNHSANPSPHSTPNSQRRVIIANPYADHSPDTRGSLLTQSLLKSKIKKGLPRQHSLPDYDRTIDYNHPPDKETGVVVETVTVSKMECEPEEPDRVRKKSAPIKRKWMFGLEDLNCKLLKACIAEFLGTMMLILFCVGSANSRELAALGANAPLYYISISIAFGLGIGGIVHIISDVSGGNVNPAVSLALFLDARMSLLKMFFYWVFQFAGGFAGAGLLYGLGNHGELTSYYGWTSYSTVNTAQAFFLEAFGTMFLILTILATINERRGHASSFLQPLAIGFAILVLHIFLIPYTNCGINPVRGSVWNVVTGQGCGTEILVYLFGPLVGAMAAVPLYNYILTPCQ